MYLTKNLLQLSYPRIAAPFGMDHTTVMHGIKKIARLRASDAILAAKITDIETSLLARYDNLRPAVSAEHQSSLEEQQRPRPQVSRI